MDENTQRNTQRVDATDSQKDKSWRKGQDEADILCRLFPSSTSAFQAVELVSECSPEFIHVNHDPNEPEPTSPAPKPNSRGSGADKSSFAVPKLPKTNADIALKMSSKVRDPRIGFVFGRLPKKCDIIISREDSKRLSAAHFRVFMNQNGLLMLEDMSTNGTMVDKVMLGGIHKTSGQRKTPSTRTLDNGSIIELPIVSEKTEEWMRFIVLIPKRDEGLADYEKNLTEYLERVQQDERRATIATRANVPTPLPSKMPFAPINKATQKDSPASSSIIAARGQNNYGMKWNGGDKYNVVGYIGSGAFAMVYKLSTVQQGELYACKQIEKRRYIKDGQPGKNMHNELGIMKRISHANIVQFVESHETDRYIFIIMEFVSLGDLTVYTRDDRVMHEHMGQQVAAQIGKALHYLHGQDVVHRDVKPDNILIADHNPYVFKLSDFGLSKVVTKEDHMRTFCGTILYCAPEIYPSYRRAMAGIVYGKHGRHLDHPKEETQPYKCSVDTWGIAAVLFHLLSGHPPWTGTVEDNGSVMLRTIISVAPDWEKLTLAGVSPLAVDFLRNMLQIFPDKRATDEQVLAHRWIRNIVTGNLSEEHQEKNTKAKEKSDNEPLEDDGDLPDASQLDINDNNALPKSDDLLTEAGSRDVSNNNLTRLDPTDVRHSDESWQDWDPEFVTMPDGRPPQAEPRLQMQPPRSKAQANTRLFGEIPESALQSSGILGQNANEALDIQDSQMEDRGSFSAEEVQEEAEAINRHEDEDISSLNDDDMTDLEEKIINALQADSMTGLQGEDHDSIEDEDTQQDLSNNAYQPTRRSFPRGREDIKLRDPHSRDFARVLNPHRRQDEFSSPQDHEVDNDGTQPQEKISALKSSRPHPPHFFKPQRTESLQKNLKISSAGPAPSEEGSGYVLGEEMSEHQTHQNGEAPRRSKRNSQHNPPSPSNETRSKRSRTAGNEFQLSQDSSGDDYPLAANSKRPRSSPPLDIGAASNNSSAYHASRLAKNVTPPQQTGPNLDTTAPQTTATTLTDPSNPTISHPLGTLTPTPGSIPTLPSIILNRRVTTFGRAPHLNTHPHPGTEATPNWTRVGRNALDLTFWYPGIDAQIATSTLPANWYENPLLRCLISTRTNRYILINGVTLRRSEHGWDYGVLRTGDLVAVVKPDLSREAVHEYEMEELVFRCEFYGGVSAPVRDVKEPFLVLTETAGVERKRPAAVELGREGREERKERYSKGFEG